MLYGGNHVYKLIFPDFIADSREFLCEGIEVGELQVSDHEIPGGEPFREKIILPTVKEIGISRLVYEVMHLSCRLFHVQPSVSSIRRCMSTVFRLTSRPGESGQ